MMKRMMSLSFFCCAFGLALAQSKPIATIQTAAEIVNAAVDRAGDFYIILKTGELQKFDKDGKQIGTFANKSVPTIFDPTNALRLLLFNHDQQNYTWLSPDLGEHPFQKIDATVAIAPALLCPSGDLNLWVLDQPDLSLKRFSPTTKKILSEFSIRNQFNEKTLFIAMREYQNFLFLLDPETGIHIYNYLGKRLKKIEVKGLTTFNFLGEELYYLHDNKITFIDLFTAETREIKLEQPAQFVLLTDERFVSLSRNQVVISAYRP